MGETGGDQVMLLQPMRVRSGRGMGERGGLVLVESDDRGLRMLRAICRWDEEVFSAAMFAVVGVVYSGIFFGSLLF